MKLDKIWLVTQPTEGSTINNLVFGAHNVTALAGYFRHGLDPEAVDSLWTTPDEALTRAQELLDARDADPLAAPHARAK